MVLINSASGDIFGYSLAGNRDIFAVGLSTSG